jgi:hypothetical protein
MGNETKNNEIREARIRYACWRKYETGMADDKLAVECHVSVHTIADWKKSIIWKAQARVFAAIQARACHRHIVGLARKAVVVIEAGLTDENPKLRLDTAKWILGHSLDRIDRDEAEITVLPMSELMDARDKVGLGQNPMETTAMEPGPEE